MNKEETVDLANLFSQFETEFINRMLDLLDNNTRIFYEELRRTRDEIEKERSEWKDRAITAETKLKLYEAMFEKLNLNLELNSKEGKK